MGLKLEISAWLIFVISMITLTIIITKLLDALVEAFRNVPIG